MALAKTNGPEVIDIDGNKALDISGSYGVNVCGYEAYKGFMAEGWKSAKDKGLYLGSLDETTSAPQRAPTNPRQGPRLTPGMSCSATHTLGPRLGQATTSR